MNTSPTRIFSRPNSSPKAHIFANILLLYCSTQMPDRGCEVFLFSVIQRRSPASRSTAQNHTWSGQVLDFDHLNRAKGISVIDHCVNTTIEWPKGGRLACISREHRTRTHCLASAVRLNSVGLFLSASTSSVLALFSTAIIITLMFDCFHSCCKFK